MFGICQVQVFPCVQFIKPMRSRTPQSRLQRGFTLVEALVVLALIGILVLIGMPALFRLFQNLQVKTAARQVAAQIRLARNNSVTQKAPHRMVIRNKDASTNINTYVVELDPEDDGSYTILPNLDFRLPPGIVIEDSPVFNSGVATISMDTRGIITSASVTTPPYSIDFKSPNGLTLRIQIHISGAVEVQTL